MPWFKQTSVWGVIISITALTFSQLPPIGSWFAAAKVTTEMGSRIGLFNNIGIPGFQGFLDLKNSGNKTASIANIRLEISYPNGFIKRVNAQSYAKLLSGQSNSLDFPITSITLNPGQNWAELISFNSDFSPSDEEELNKLRLQISQSIFSKMQARGGAAGPYIEADAQFVVAAGQFFDKKFDLEKGDYRMVFKCDVNGSEITLKQASFTLYDYHIATLKSQKEDFKYGAGIYYPLPAQKQVWALLSRTL